jgi:hypothetical protein
MTLTLLEKSILLAALYRSYDAQYHTWDVRVNRADGKIKDRLIATSELIDRVLKAKIKG